MTYVGRGVDAISNVEKLDNITFDGSTTYNLTKSSVAFTPSGANNILISIDGVVQSGNFSIANNTIVFDWSPTSSNTCNWIQHYGVGVLNVPADSSITAAKMAANSVDSDSYVDGSIDTAHIADDQITLAKMASGTDGNIISYDASGNPVAIATGSDGQVLTSTGAGSPPAFEAAPSTSFNGIDDTSSSNDDCVTITDNEVVINEDGDNQDFRVESDDQPNFFFCDASANIAGFSKHDRPDMGFVHITSASSGVSSVDGDADELVIENSGSAGISILTGTSNEGSIKFGDSGDNNIGIIQYAHDSDSMEFKTAAAERFRVNSSGDLCLGKTVPVSASQLGGVTLAPLGRCNISYTGTGGHATMSYFNGNGEIGSISCSGSATSFNTSSDYRLKENKTSITDGIDRVKQLKPYRFNFIADNDEDGNPTKTLDGFFAHEVSSIVPEAVSGEKDAMNPEVLYTADDELPEGKNIGDIKEATSIKPQGIDQSKIVPLLVASVQELIAENETLKTRITALENA